MNTRRSAAETELSSSTPKAQPDQDSVRRPFTVDDLFELEGIGMYYGGPYAWSADGGQLAFTMTRAKEALANHKWEFLWGNAGGDVWVQSTTGEQPERVTNGRTDGSGWWSPQWSPDGSVLAMLSTRGGNVRLWMWDRATNELTKLGERGVGLCGPHERPFLWIDDRQVLYPALADGEQPRGMRIELETPTIATREWPKVERGQEVTASALESGVDVDLNSRPRGELQVVDVVTGTERTISRGSVRSWHLSPDAKTVAFTRTVSTSRPMADLKLAFGSREVAALKIALLDGTPIELDGEISQDVVEGSVRWSPDGAALAFLGYAEDWEQPPQLYQVDLVQRTVATLPLPGLDAAPIIRESAQLEWTAARSLIVFAATVSAVERFGVTGRRDWWLITETGPPELLTGQLDDPPRELWPEEGSATFAGVADGNLWRITPDTGMVENLTETFDLEVKEQSWPARTNKGIDQYRLPDRSYTQVVVSVQTRRDLDPYLVDLHTGEISPIKKPYLSADLMAYEPQTGTAIFQASDRNGLQVWSVDVRNGASLAMVHTNEFLAQIAEGEFRKLEYTSLNGETLSGWLLLPVGYQRGQRYPLLTWVYAGTVQGERPPSHLGTINSTACLNLQIPAANGYAVLFPSMPLAPEGVPDDPMLRLSNGVLPAVEEAIESGVADPSRLYVMGQSFGGFSTYGLVTQTKRFHAAVALAGLSNLISLYGQFDARERYTDRPQDDPFLPAMMDSGPLRMGNPPWKDLGRYIRNSPIFFVDRVETPIMIVQGDMDYVAIQQGEEFFMSLYRQGKRASFVRYWGEGHVLQSPANIRDLWQRIFHWLEQFPRPGESHEA